MHIGDDTRQRESCDHATRDERTRIEELRARAHACRALGQLDEAADAFMQIAQWSQRDWRAQHNAGALCIETQRHADAVRFFERALELHPNPDGWSLYAHTLAVLGRMSEARDAYEAAVALAPSDFRAHWGLFEVLQLLDDNRGALEHQRLALAQRSLVTIEARVQPARLTILELCIAGTFQANIPLDFILDTNRTTVHKLYLGEHPVPPLPSYDLVFNTIADAPDAQPALAAAAALIAAQDRPVLNSPALVPLTSRDSVASLFAGSSSVAVAPTRRVTRAAVSDTHPAFPFLIRPLDSHAGNDLAKIDDADELAQYLAAKAQVDDFYVADFIDYRNADGWYRKYRIMFVGGVPYPVHLAISQRWMIHYYNAPMAEHSWMRAEEAAFLADPASVFDGVRADGLREIARLIPLDYFGIDCSIAPDGRVLLFEASTAMIVHLRDSVEMYPYKAQYVPRVISALEHLFDERCAAPARA